MAAAEEAQAASAAAAPAPSIPKGPLLMAAANTLAILGAMGLLAYTRLVYKRPAITEDAERARITQAHGAHSSHEPTPGMVLFDPFTVNIKAGQLMPKQGDEETAPGKTHHASVGFAIALRDVEKREALETIRPVLMDRIMFILGQKTFQELTTVQGRFVLRTQMIELVNTLATERAKTREPLATNIFFTQFVVQ